MRVLFTTLAASGHIHPLVPVARALTEAGHEVAFACAEEGRSTIERLGFRFFPAGTTMRVAFAEAESLRATAPDGDQPSDTFAVLSQRSVFFFFVCAPFSYIYWFFFPRHPCPLGRGTPRLLAPSCPPHVLDSGQDRFFILIQFGHHNRVVGMLLPIVLQSR